MKHSIRKQILSAFVFIMTGTILLCLFLNNTLLEKYYLYEKQKVMIKVYDSLNDATYDGSIQSDQLEQKLEKLSSIYNVGVIVIDADSRLVLSAGYETDMLMNSLLDRVFMQKMDNIKIVSEDEHYILETEHNPRNDITYIQIWGTLDNGNLFMTRSVVESIQDSVLLANRFLAYAGLLSILICGIVILILTKRITDPILSLTDISKRMANLDFEIHYTGKEKNEIGILGQHMNELSDRLKQTVSELKTANNELQKDIQKKEQTDEMRREFLSNVSHELKTPLALIMGYAEGLKEEIAQDNPENRDFYCDVIIDESNKMNDMVKKLLTLNQLEFGNEVVNMERFDICELIRNFLISANILIKQSNAEVSFEYEETCYVWSDEYKTEEVLMNYFSNALHYLGGDRKIEITIRPHDDIARISVYNTGEPIPEEALPHLFEKFYKVDKARTREYGGNGVGLSIVKAIMDSVHQSYGVLNRDAGVEFWFELPMK